MSLLPKTPANKKSNPKPRFVDSDACPQFRRCGPLLLQLHRARSANSEDHTCAARIFRAINNPFSFFVYQLFGVHPAESWLPQAGVRLYTSRKQGTRRGHSARYVLRVLQIAAHRNLVPLLNLQQVRGAPRPPLRISKHVLGRAEPQVLHRLSD